MAASPTCIILSIGTLAVRWAIRLLLAEDYQKMVASIGDAVRFMETLSGSEVHNLNRIDFYTSHEALLLPYEEALTRQSAAPMGLVQPEHALPVDRYAHRGA